MTVRLQWSSPAEEQGGAFTLTGAPLFLVVSGSGGLDRLHQDPGERDGFLVQENGAGGLHLEARGSCVLGGGKVEVELEFGNKVEAQGQSGVWTLVAEGKAVVEDPLVGTELGGHRVVARLGNGSMGVVYRAVQINLDREVALKVLDPKAAKSSPLAVASFKREAVAAGRLSHPNLVQVYDVGQDRGLHFFSMELVPGGDLEGKLAEQTTLSWQEALEYVLDATAALQFAREHQLVHRDVKPENLMLTVDGRCKLADLGMAATRGMVESESAGGTPHFMAPECVGGGAIDYRSDFYSLGCTLYRLLTGKTPYQGAAVRDILRAHRDDPVPRLKDAGVEAPAGVQELVDWLMAKDPADRPQDAQEILDEVHDRLDGKRSRGLILGLGVVAVAAVGVSLFFALREQPNAEPEQVIVEVENPDAAANRERAALLELQLAFTTAMAVEEGEGRTTALQEFLATYPDSDYTLEAETEIERLASLPEQPEVDVAVEDPFAAEREILAALEVSLAGHLEAKEFGQCLALLATSSLPAEWLPPLRTRVDQAATTAFGLWGAEHGVALTEEKWATAEASEQAMRASFAQAPEVPAEWTALVDGLTAARMLSEQTAAARDFALARAATLAAMNRDVLPDLDRWQFQSAAVQLQAMADACTHADLQLALQQRVSLLEQAGAVQDALFEKLNTSDMLPVNEALEGRRAFVTGASAEGLALMVQVRGERVARLDPWSLYEDPAVLIPLMDAAFGKDQPLAQRQALLLAVASRSLARVVAGWSSTPDAQTATDLASLSLVWQQALADANFAEGDPAQAELQAIQELMDLANRLAEGDPYGAYLHAQGLQNHFSLLSVWSSDGRATWGLLP
ncbi:MAG: serine/threonine-protein kinase [Planctomycetota bacterium]